MGQGYEKQLFPKVISQEFVHLLHGCTHWWYGSEAVQCGEQDNTQTKQGSYKVKAFLMAQ